MSKQNNGENVKNFIIQVPQRGTSRGGAKRDRNTLSEIRQLIVPLPVRPGKIAQYHQTFEAHGQTQPLDIMCRFIAIVPKEEGRAIDKELLYEGSWLTPGLRSLKPALTEADHASHTSKPYDMIIC